MKNCFSQSCCISFAPVNSNTYLYSCTVERQVVEVKKSVKHKSGTTITWNHLNLDCDGVSREYSLNFTKNDLLVFTGNTTSNSFNCGSECENATMFFIWAVVDGKKWGKKGYVLLEKGESYMKITSV